MCEIFLKNPHYGVMGDPQNVTQFWYDVFKKNRKNHLVANNESISNFEKEIKFNLTGASGKASELNRKSQ